MPRDAGRYQCFARSCNKRPGLAEWSRFQLSSASLRGTLDINDVIYAELSIRYARVEDLDKMLRLAGIGQLAMPRAALFLAGKAFVQYRARGGTRTGVLPDFFVGAHAAITGITLLTRDASRYRTYFPGTMLVAPDRAAPPFPRRGATV